MAKIARIVPANLSHNVGTRFAHATHTLSELATVYLVTEAAGQSRATLDAKRRDLQRFLTFYQTLYGHARPDEWFASVTKAFLQHLQHERLAQASRVRIYATVRHFARWLHRQWPTLFRLGCPTEGVKPPAEPPADWKGLSRREELWLRNAAQSLRVWHGTGTDQGLRNHALLVVLLGSGLRVSEVLNLEKDQYTGQGFTRVHAKGGVVREFVPVHREARQVLEEWLEARHDAYPPLFITRTGRRLSRREAATIMRRMAAQANAHVGEEERMDVSPHVLRHTFLRKLAEAKGVQYAKEAAGHQSDRYIWRYVKPDRQTLAEAIDALE